MAERLSRLKLIIITCLILSFFPQSVSADINDKYNKAWQHLGIRRLFSESLSSEEAILWHLDYNGFAVRLPNSLLVFDYDNEIPAPQYDKKSEIGIVESLLTGVINPEELKDERVVFFSRTSIRPRKYLSCWRGRI